MSPTPGIVIIGLSGRNSLMLVRVLAACNSYFRPPTVLQVRDKPLVWRAMDTIRKEEALFSGSVPAKYSARLDRPSPSSSASGSRTCTIAMELQLVELLDVWSERT